MRVVSRELQVKRRKYDGVYVEKWMVLFFANPYIYLSVFINDKKAVFPAPRVTCYHDEQTQPCTHTCMKWRRF